jgi:hypothetical protein
MKQKLAHKNRFQRKADAQHYGCAQYSRLINPTKFILKHLQSIKTFCQRSCILTKPTMLIVQIQQSNDFFVQLQQFCVKYWLKTSKFLVENWISTSNWAFLA